LQAYANQGVTGYYATFDNLEISSLNTGRVIASPVLTNPVFTAGANQQFRLRLCFAGECGFYAVETQGRFDRARLDGYEPSLWQRQRHDHYQRAGGRQKHRAF